MTLRRSQFIRSYGKNHVYNDDCLQCGALIGNYGSYASHPYCTGCAESQKRLKEAQQRAFGNKDAKTQTNSTS